MLLVPSLSFRVTPDRVPPRADIEDHGGGVPAGDAGGGDAGSRCGSHHLPLPGSADGVALQLSVGAAEPQEGGSPGGQRHQLHCAQDRRPAAPTGGYLTITQQLQESSEYRSIMAVMVCMCLCVVFRTVS